MIAEVVFNLPLERAFDYLIPPRLERQLRIGTRVLAPFGRRELIGYVIGLRAKSPVRQLKSLLKLLDEQPLLPPSGLRLARWLSDHYCCSLGEACASMVPTALRLRTPLPGEDTNQSPQETAQAFPAEPAPVFTAPQREAFAKIASAMASHRHQTFLVHGVTGSGKTELYLRAIEETLKQGRAAICLVPEIALTPQIIERFHQRFGPEVALWHSRLTPSQRAQAWRRLAEGRSRIAVGTRSAVFAPLDRLGLIVLDEEHDPSYKQGESPRYHAREVAIARARWLRSVVLLGSATPSVESYAAAQQGRFCLVELPERVRGQPLPRVELVDLRQESATFRKAAPISGRLAVALRGVVDRQEQAILLLNRRGFARVVQCPVCGAVVRCTRCAVPLVFHASAKQMTCHYCNVRQTPPETCPACHRGYMRFRGVGTERIESELHRLFPVSRIGRMDADTTKQRESHRHLYESIKTRQIDLLVGTQMVAKGLDVPQVTLVGVVSADTALNLPDFRAGERTFDLLTQVAGRAGRGDQPGRVVIQTYCPSHYAIQAASRHDYHEFYRAEIQMRKRLRLPPFTRLIELTVQGSHRERVQDAAAALGKALQATLRRSARGSGITVLGPAPHRLMRLRRTFRWRVILKATAVGGAVRLVRRTLKEGRRFQGLPVIVDVDPL